MFTLSVSGLPEFRFGQGGRTNPTSNHLVPSHMLFGIVITPNTDDDIDPGVKVTEGVMKGLWI